jgi:hypothetical protein
MTTDQNKDVEPALGQRSRQPGEHLLERRQVGAEGPVHIAGREQLVDPVELTAAQHLRDEPPDDVEELIAEADAVVPGFALEMRDQAGKTISVRGLTYYRLADGKIVEDDPITTPELTQELGPLIAPALA